MRESSLEMVQDYVWIFFFGLGPLSLSSSVSHGRDRRRWELDYWEPRASDEREKEGRKKERKGCEVNVTRA